MFYEVKAIARAKIKTDKRDSEVPAHLHACAGVIPSIHGSGDKTYHGKIIRAGNRWLRWACVTSS